MSKPTSGIKQDLASHCSTFYMFNDMLLPICSNTKLTHVLWVWLCQKWHKQSNWHCCNCRIQTGER